jgi:hypothetical protein
MLAKLAKYYTFFIIVLQYLKILNQSMHVKFTKPYNAVFVYIIDHVKHIHTRYIRKSCSNNQFSQQLQHPLLKKKDINIMLSINMVEL